MHSIGKDKAIELAKSKWWEGKTSREICDIQLFTSELCMDFSTFHGAIEEALGRPVFTHEFGLNLEGIVAEYLGEKESPSLDDILKLIPHDKLLVVNY